tara:strand:+ start:44 stop:250 length:207 start_codon:yes stop_codon:yes gene_type:complete
MEAFKSPLLTLKLKEHEDYKQISSRPIRKGDYEYDKVEHEAWNLENKHLVLHNTRLRKKLYLQMMEDD